MGICVFSRKGILYEKDKHKGALIGIVVPSEEQKRHYSDLSNPSKSVIKERYGILDGEPLYRNEGGSVIVYGQLPNVLYDLRNEVDVFLPEDLVPLDASVLYFVFGNNLIVHSVRTIETDGTVHWSSVAIELEKSGAGAINILENLISERIVAADDDKITVAYTGLEEDVKESLYERINQFGAVIEPLEKLNNYKSRTPVYSHKDNSIYMLIFIIIAVVLFILSIIYYISGTALKGKTERSISALQQEYKESLSKRRLKQVANPQEVKDSIEKPFLARPSAIIHAAAEVAAMFGVLDSIELEKRRFDKITKEVENLPADNVIYVIAIVKSPYQKLLIDQEKIANSIYETRKWIRVIERNNEVGNEYLTLKIGIYVGEDGGIQ